MSKSMTVEDIRAHAATTRRLVARALGEGNVALARELERIAREAERRLPDAA